MWRSGASWNDADCDQVKPYICGYPGGPDLGSGSTNMATGLPTGDCAFDPCVAAGTCDMVTDHAQGGNQAGPNGIRTCGAASSSNVGWGGEPDRAIDGNPDGNWGAGSCTHTDGPGSFATPGTHWWQVDLGQSVAVESVNIYHRTNCCQDRLLGATVYVSADADYSTGAACGAVDDHLGQPDVTICNNAVGQYVTVERLDMIITICELEVMGVAATSMNSDNAVTTTLASSIDGMVTYQLHAQLSDDQSNVYALAGTVDQGLDMPAAFQVAAPFGADVGGVSPAFYSVNADAEFDSWLTVGSVDGSAGAGLATVGLNLASWSLDAGFSADNGAVFWMDPNAGPGGSDPICVAQLTVAAGSSFTASGLLQGRSAGGAADWSAAAAWGSGSGGGGGGGGGGGPMSASASVDIVATSGNGDTAQLSFSLSAEKANVYAMAGTADMALTVPAGFQVAAPFGADIGGVSPAFFAVNADAEFDSWLTIGPTDGTAGAGIAASPGLGLDSWNADTPFSTSNGAIFWMSPDGGPSGVVVLAQVTGAGGSASAQLQGRSVSGEDWSEAVQWSW